MAVCWNSNSKTIQIDGKSVRSCGSFLMVREGRGFKIVHQDVKTFRVGKESFRSDLEAGLLESGWSWLDIKLHPDVKVLMSVYGR